VRTAFGGFSAGDGGWKITHPIGFGARITGHTINIGLQTP